MRTVYTVLVCICLSGALCGQASAIPGEPTANIEQQGKVRVFSEYMTVFRKAWLKSRDELLSSDEIPYDRNALEGATAEYDRQMALCKSRREELKTEEKYAACVIAAKRLFASAISLRDLGLIEAMASTLTQVAGDTDAGRLTRDQARDVYAEFEEMYKQLFGLLSAFYDDQLGVRLAASYKDRFLKSYQQLVPPTSQSADRPPLDDAAEGPAAEILTEARGACDSVRSSQVKVYADCILAAEKHFSDVVKLRDRKLYEAFETTLRAAAADLDSKRLTPVQFNTVAAWLIDAYTENIHQQQYKYHVLAARLVAEGYVIRFGAAYAAVSGEWLNDTIMPYEASAMDQAVRGQQEAVAGCQTKYNAAASEAVNLECNISAYRGFAQAIKLRDKNLLETYISALRGAAADTDAGRLTKWQKDVVYEALSRYFYSVYSSAADAYLAKFYRVVAKPYLLRFDNAFIAARGTETDEDSAPPWDVDAVPLAQRAYDQSIRSCYERRTELKTHLAYWECRTAAEKALAVSIHRRDMTVLETASAALSQAAADADAGKISADQLTGIVAALTGAYYRINEDAWRVWHIKQQRLETVR
ncbi:MAG TPA: hypothetical protein VFI23_00370 [Rhizomicrobium sp.]|nr:hypothetical protein [Rhizomicrobium sp.]